MQTQLTEVEYSRELECFQDDYAERAKFYRGLFKNQNTKPTGNVTRKPRLKRKAKKDSWENTVSLDTFVDEYKDWITESGASPDAEAYFEKTYGAQRRLDYKAAVEGQQRLLAN